MPYIGRSTDGFGVRNRFLYLASASDTSVSGADANGATLSFSDGAYVDVYLNGVLLKAGTDYNTNTANTIAGISSMSANDEVTVIVYDIFAVADTVSQSSGGTFSGAITFDSTVSGLDVNGTEIILDADGDTTITADTDDTIDIKIGGSDIFQMTASKLDLNGKELVLDADADTSITADTDDRIDFRTAGSDRMKINSNGSVGIGTATTTGDLNISPVVGSYTTIQMTTGGTSTGNIIYFGDSSDADYSSITSFGSGAGENGRMRFIVGTRESVNIYSNGAFNTDALSDGGTAGIIKNSGTSNIFGIAITTPNVAQDNNTQYFISCQDSGTERFKVFSDGDVSTSDAGILSSDEKLKHTITDATDKWDDVKKLKVRNFYWKEDFHPAKKDHKMIGFIAQEFETVFPKLVTNLKDTIIKDDKVVDLGTTTKSIKEGKLIPILTKALQEAMARIETLEAKVKALEEA